MKQLYFATSNKWKFGQARDYFKKHGIRLVRFDIELPESRSEDVYKIARNKVRFAYRKLKKPVFIIDAAFYIKALNDFPKTYVKFVKKYLGAGGILKLLRGVEDRRWEFPNVVYYKDEKQEKHFTGIIKGMIIKELEFPEEDKTGYRFDSIQIPDGYNKTFAEMSERELRDFDEDIWKPTVFDEFIRWLGKFQF